MNTTTDSVSSSGKSKKPKKCNKCGKTSEHKLLKMQGPILKKLQEQNPNIQLVSQLSNILLYFPKK